ncbi:lipopolysaccharide biosynthesis protein [Thioclava sp. JE_KL1]|uniref:lipopolysaccharide biosynthesis protein n=1 Tax=Thioclava sp. JE_KL1 TaxID=2651187 RepID=UPI001561D4DC|nr:polysaccharide biosynthesis C-terminal domain-containing protein [Thioclava sp. JE_KL1]
MVYLAANLAAAAVPFTMLPVLVRLIDKAEYGQVAIFQAFVNMTLAIVGVNTVGAVKRHYFVARNDGASGEASYAHLIGTTLAILAASFALSFVVVLAFGRWLVPLTGLDTRALTFGLVFAAASFVVNLRLADYQVRGRAAAFGIMQVGMALANLLLSLIIVLWFLRSAEGRILGVTLSGVAVAAIALVSLARAGLIRWPVRAAVKEALAFGLPLVPHALGMFLLASADRFFIKTYVGLAEVGVYAAAVQISFLLRVVNDAMNKSFQPWVFDRLSRGNDTADTRLDTGRVVVGAFYRIGAVSVVMAGFLALSGPFFIPILLGAGYADAAGLIPILALGTAFHGLYLYLINVLLYTRRTSALASTTIVLGLINLGLLFLLVPRWGAQGAAWAFAIASLMRVLTVGGLCRKAWPLSWTKPRFSVSPQ